MSRDLTNKLKSYTLDSMQYYRTKYLLSKIAQFVDMPMRGTKIPGSLKEYTVLEIEHILPNSPKADLKADFVNNNPGIDYEICKTKLGNLTLLQKPLNIVAGNSWFNEKCDKYKACRIYLTWSIAEIVTIGNNSQVNQLNKHLLAFAKWDSAAIDQRQDMLINLVFMIWKIDTI